MPTPFLTRRRLLGGGAALLAAGLPPVLAQTPRIPLADMHSHYGMFRQRLPGFDLAAQLRESGTTLLAWAATDDGRWIGETSLGLRQQRTPAPGELWAAYQRRVAGYDAQLAKWGLAKALMPADIDAALAGEPRVLLSSEGASFLEGQVERLAQAHAWGLRQLQLMHYIRNPLGDHQTDEPVHGGLSALGAQVVVECRRLGMVLDLAHGTPSLVDAALDAYDGVPIWSHSWIAPQAGQPGQWSYLARALPLASARKIAARGGTVGLWTVRVRGDRSYPVRDARSFADETLRMCDLIGPEHVAFGTDMEGAGRDPILSDYADLRGVADDLVRRGLPEARLRDLFIGNYARVVKRAMTGAKA